MNAEPDIAHPKIVLPFERWLVIACAVAALGLLTWQAPPDLTRPGEAALILLFSALLVYYPIHLLQHEYFLLSIITLGAAILFGAATAAWCATLGAALGFGLRRLSLSRRGNLPFAARMYWVGAVQSICRHNLALLLAFILTSLPVGLASAEGKSLPATAVWSLWQPLIAFACLDGLLFLIDSLLEKRGSLETAWRDLPLLVLAEFSALPFIWITAVSYPVIGVGALVILGSLPTIISMLINGLENYQADLIEHRQELAELSQVSALITASQNSGEVLEQICNLAVSRCRAKGAAIYLSDPQASQVWLAHACQLSKVFVQTNGTFSLADDSRAHCLRSAQAVLIPNLRQAGGQRSDLTVLREEHIRALGEFPLLTSQGAIGYLAMYFDNPHSFQAGETNLLLILASLSALAVSNARLQSRSDQPAIAVANVEPYGETWRGRDQLTTILNSVGEGILVIDDQGIVILANPGVEAISGIRSEQLVSHSLEELPAASLETLGLDLKLVHELLERIAPGRISVPPKIIYRMKSPEIFIERSILPVWGDQGRISGWIIVLRDVSDERRLEQARELITETLVHDLRSPLSAILGAVAFLQEDLEEKGKLDDVSRQGLQVAQRAGARVMGLVESLLEISRMQAGRIELSPSPVNLYTLAASIQADYLQQANDLGIILRNEIPGDLPTVRADSAKLGRVFANLLDNALKFTPSGGQVSISANLQADGMAAVRISDTGPGIPEEFRQKIFERFTQVPGRLGRRRGSGLGLTFCRLVMEAHGGSIWAEADPGGGSVFVLTLPTGAESDRPLAQPSAPAGEMLD